MGGHKNVRLPWLARQVILGCQVLPSARAQVSTILKYCNDRRLAVCPQGGNTGLVGGSIPVHDEVVLSLERMRHVTKFDAVSGVLVCGAGTGRCGHHHSGICGTCSAEA